MKTTRRPKKVLPRQPKKPGFTIIPTIAVVVVLAVLIGASVFLAHKFPKTPEQTSGTDTVQAIAPGAFGELTATTTQPTAERNSAVEPSKVDTSSSQGVGMMPSPAGTSFRYTVSALPSLPASVNVLAWKKHTVSLDQVLNTENLGVFDFSRIPKSALNTLSATTADGYRVDVNLDDGTVSIAIADFGRAGTQAEAKLSDAEILAIAKRFLDRFGISTDGYGTPSIQNQNVGAYGAPVTTDSALLKPIAAQTTVTYPLVVNGKPVAAMWGGTTGMTITVDRTQKRVTYLYGIRQLSWESSSYDASSSEQFQKDLAQGGLANIPTTQTENVQDVLVGSPELVYTSIYHYADSVTKELLVPAYRFTAQNPPAGALSEVIVPLVPNLMTYPTIEPMMQGSGTSGSGTSTGSTTPPSDVIAPDAASPTPAVLPQ